MSGDVELRRAAEAATPGPWYADDTYDTVTAEPYRSAREAYDRNREAFDDDCWIVPESMDSGVGGHNLAFIAAANPAVVLALLDRLDTAEGALRRVEALADDWVDNAGKVRPARTYAHLGARLRAALDPEVTP